MSESEGTGLGESRDRAGQPTGIVSQRGCLSHHAVAGRALAAVGREACSNGRSGNRRSKVSAGHALGAARRRRARIVAGGGAVFGRHPRYNEQSQAHPGGVGGEEREMGSTNTLLLYHLVFTTKDRYAFINESRAPMQVRTRIPVYCSIETTVTDLGSSWRASLPPWIFAETGLGATVSGASKVLTLSTLGAVSVSPTADLAVTPPRLTSISRG